MEIEITTQSGKAYESSSGDWVHSDAQKAARDPHVRQLNTAKEQVPYEKGNFHDAIESAERL
jgi:hypothetical protein